MGVILVPWVSVRQCRPEAGLRLREGNHPKSATSPFPVVTAPDNLPQTPKGLCPYCQEQVRKERRGGKAPGRPPGFFLSASHPLGAPISGPALVWPTIPLKSLLTPLSTLAGSSLLGRHGLGSCSSLLLARSSAERFLGSEDRDSKCV